MCFPTTGMTKSANGNKSALNTRHPDIKDMSKAGADSAFRSNRNAAFWDALRCTGLSGLTLHGDVNKRQRSAAERFVLAEDQSQVTPNLRIGDGDSDQTAGTH